MRPVKHCLCIPEGYANPRPPALAQFCSERFHEGFDICPSDVASRWFFKDLFKSSLVLPARDHSVNI